MGVTIKIKHQLINKNRFYPKWKINKLFIGTFNPENGDSVDYYLRPRKVYFLGILRRHKSWQ